MLKKQKLLPKNLSSETTHGGAFPTCPAKRLTADRMFLCGDAAGLVNPMTGEGIYYAMCSGEMAAKTAISALENDKTDAHSLKQYQNQWKHEFHLDLFLLNRISKRWGKNIEPLIEVVSKDKKFIDLVCSVIPSPGGIQQERMRLARRLIFIYCKNRLKK